VKGGIELQFEVTELHFVNQPKSKDGLDRHPEAPQWVPDGRLEHSTPSGFESCQRHRLQKQAAAPVARLQLSLGPIQGQFYPTEFC